MKKTLLISLLSCAALVLTGKTGCLHAQAITVPDFAYGEVNTEHGFVSYQGFEIHGGYSKRSDARQSGIFLADGYRWWEYYDCGPPLTYCRLGMPTFDFPGLHGSGSSCMGSCVNPYTGYEASWGGVVADPENRTIWCLIGSVNSNGPTADRCVPFGLGQICYPPPQYWGNGTSYGYLRKEAVVQSTGSLKQGDPVNIKAGYTAHRLHSGEGISSTGGFLLLNKRSQLAWHREYLTWADRELFRANVPMLAKLILGQNIADDSTVTVAVGDTILLELLFFNAITHLNPLGNDNAEGWMGEKPEKIVDASLNYYEKYAKLDSVKEIIKEYGNSLTYDLICLTQGAILSPLAVSGQNIDEDKDGISDIFEKGADGNNNSFDGNADGIPDYKQSNVASFHTYDGQNYVTMVVPAGTTLSQVTVTSNPSPSNTPAGDQFPFGFFDFSIDGLDPGEAVDVKLILHNAASITKYYKYGPTPDNTTRHWYDFTYDGQTGAGISGNVITLHFVDGLRGDEDITVNGSIKDPGGPAVAGTTGINEMPGGAGITVYPNPADDAITLKLNSIIPRDDYILRIISISGQTMQEKTINVTDSGEEFTLPTDNLPAGIYMISLSGYNISYKSKFIKLK